MSNVAPTWPATKTPIVGRLPMIVLRREHDEEEHRPEQHVIVGEPEGAAHEYVHRVVRGWCRFVLWSTSNASATLGLEPTRTHVVTVRIAK